MMSMINKKNKAYGPCHNERHESTVLSLQRDLRKIYNSVSLDTYSLQEIEAARVQLLKYKTPLMQSWDWMTRDVVRYLTRCLMQKKGYLAGSKEETSEIRDILVAGYQVIMDEDDSRELEYQYLAFVKSLHEWLFRYQYGNAVITKKVHQKEWWSLIVWQANHLVRTLNWYRELQERREQMEQQEDSEPVRMYR